MVKKVFLIPPIFSIKEINWIALTGQRFRLALVISNSKRPWLNAGLTVLYKQGPTGLTIENLTKLTRLTKGSFYHHFRDREQYSRELLEFWEYENTTRIIKISEISNKPVDKMRRLAALVVKLSGTTDVAVRAWSRMDPTACEFVERVDQKRRAYVEKLLYEQCGNRKQAVLFAELFYAAYIGLMHIQPPATERYLRKNLIALGKLIDVGFKIRKS